ncbi:hypothetical protein N1851_021796 [Merluccius polli]|uniref:Uncharacterized protein n=1 Tax=Merluccius polli TaxID=89951 RepID=A0AA47MJ09_MERPO|nr:hypothetical protein N1851_021796 [Merluccius polli]
MRLLIECLVHKGMIPTKSLSDLLSSITCNSEDQKCMSRQCTICCFDEVQLNLHNPSDLARWEQWQREEVTVGEKVYKNWVKKGVSGTLRELADTFLHDLESIASHQFNWMHQAGEAASNHTYSVAYTKTGCRSFATISKSLRHDERAVWAHLQPVIEDLQNQRDTPFKSLHVISDGPVTQYRNKPNCFLMSTVPFSWGFQCITWNYSERGHGKGAPDGVGACVKRMADQFVLNGRDLQTPEALYDLLSSKDGMKIKIKWIEEKDIEKFDELLPPVIPAVKGILGTHQICSTAVGKVFHRAVSCFCNYPSVCGCFKAANVTMTPGSPAHEVSSPPPSLDDDDECDQDVVEVGRFIIVRYDEKRYVGQILAIQEEEIQVSCMA